MSDEQEIFDEAMTKPPSHERAIFLEQACAGDRELRARVEALLAAHERAGTFLESPPPGITVAEQASLESPGAIIGNYKLLEQIGEGGMGVVFMAEQLRPVQRRVALKIIKPGLDTKQVIARFEAERQALAKMDHPNIAKVLDAGATEASRPYFVMELVRGIPITEYCDQHQLTPRQRLELFIPVCQAVQHAHQKGIIHRDLKPTNVLITLQDGDKPTPKVIDFGIAKATAGQKLTDRTLFTEFRQLIGTPLYMSPEQAEMSALLDVDTRSDVYSLGVLLYELLTGTTPFDKQRLAKAAFDEVRRIIREEEPPRPSTRLSTLGETPTTVSAQRQTDPKKLSQSVRGELDWIVMKAMEKDRTRRYETANGLAHDVERYLADETVEACPPSRAYRLRKTVRRHRFVFLTSSAVLIALLIGLAASTWMYKRERAARRQVSDLLLRTQAAEHEALAQRDEARRQEQVALAIKDFMQTMLAKASPPNSRENRITVRQAVDDAVAELDAGAMAGHPEVEGALRLTIGALYRTSGVSHASLVQVQRAVELLRPIARSKPIWRSALIELGYAQLMLGDKKDAENAFREALGLLEDQSLVEQSVSPSEASLLAMLLINEGKLSEAETLLRRALAQVTSSNAGAAAQGMLYQNLGDIAIERETWPEAESLLRKTVELYGRGSRPYIGGAFDAVRLLTHVLNRQGRYAEAQKVCADVLHVLHKAYPADHPKITDLMVIAGRSLIEQRNYTEAEKVFREALARRSSEAAAERWKILALQARVYETLIGQKRYAEAEGGLLPVVDELLRQDVEAAAKISAVQAVIFLYQEWGKPDLASKYQKTLDALASLWVTTRPTS